MLNRTKTDTDGEVMHRSTAHSIAWNYIGFAYQISINFGLTWYITRSLEVSEYGLFLFVMSLSSTLYLLDMGLSSVLVQAFVEASTNPEKNRLNSLLSTTFVALAGLGAVGVLIFVVLAAILPGPFNIPRQYVHEASVIFVIAALVIQVGFPSIAVEQVYQASNRFDRINQIQLITSTVQASLSILVLAAGFRIVGLALALLAASVLRLLLLVVAMPASAPQAHLKLSGFEWHILKPLISLSKWAFLQNLSASLFDLFVWTILGSLGSMREAAMFGLASKLPTQLKNLVNKGANVALPLMANSSAQGDQAGLQLTYLRFQKLVLGATIPFVVLGLLTARPLIQLWAGTPYTGAAPVMQWLLLAAFSHAIAYSSDLLLFACGQVKKAASISILAGVVSVASALLLVPRFGAIGLAAGLAVTQLVINCTLFTIAACKLSGTHLWTLIKVLFDGLTLPFIVLVAEVVLISTFSSHLSSLWVLIAAVISGCVYLGLWISMTALPLYRNQMETVI